MDAYSKLKMTERRQKLAEMLMMQQANQPIVGGAIPGILQGLSRVGMGALMSKGMDQEGAAQEAYSNELKGGVEKFMNTYQGTPEEVMAPGVAGPPRPGMVGNPRQAIMEAIGSRMPELQEIGVDSLKQLGRGERKRNVMNIDGKLIEVPEQGAPTQIGDYSKPPEQWEEYVKPDPATGKPTIFRKNLATGKPEQVTHPGTNVTTNVGGAQVHLPGQKKGFEEWAKAAVQDFQERAKSASGAVEMAGNLDQMAALDKDGKLISGPAADPALFIQGLAQSIGMPVDVAGLADAQTYRAMASQVAQAYINTLQGGARGITEKEAAIIMQSVPQLQQSPQARAQVTKILRDVAMRKVEDFQKARTSLNEALKTEDMSKYEFGAVMLPNPKPIEPSVQPSARPSGKGSASDPVRRKWPGAR